MATERPAWLEAQLCSFQHPDQPAARWAATPQPLQARHNPNEWDSRYQISVQPHRAKEELERT